MNSIEFLKDGGYVTHRAPLRDSEKVHIRAKCEKLAQALEGRGPGVAGAYRFALEAIHPWVVRCAKGTYGQNVPSLPYGKVIEEHLGTVLKAPLDTRRRWASGLREWAAGL